MIRTVGEAGKAYCGLVAIDGDRVLLRHRKGSGYVWTWPRCPVRGGFTVPHDMHSVAVRFASAQGFRHERILSIPGTFSTIADHADRAGSRSQFWLATGDAGPLPMVVPPEPEEPATRTRAEVLANYAALQANVAAMGWGPLPDDPFGGDLPPHDEVPRLFDLEYVARRDVDRLLALSPWKPGRERDLEVWRRAQALASQPIQTFEPLGWTRNLRVDAQTFTPVDVVAGRLPFPHDRTLDVVDFELPRALFAAAHQRKFECCFTCARFGSSGMSQEAGTGYCHAADSGSEQPIVVEHALGCCPRYERTLMRLGGPQP